MSLGIRIAAAVGLSLLAFSAWSGEGAAKSAEPGMDALSAKLIGDWEKKVYDLRAEGVRSFTADVFVKLEGMDGAWKGAFRTDGTNGEVVWDPEWNIGDEEALRENTRARDDEMKEREILEFLIPRTLREQTAGCRLTAATGEAGATVSVERPEYEILRAVDGELPDVEGRSERGEGSRAGLANEFRIREILFDPEGRPSAEVRLNAWRGESIRRTFRWMKEEGKFLLEKVESGGKRLFGSQAGEPYYVSERTYTFAGERIVLSRVVMGKWSFHFKDYKFDVPVTVRPDPPRKDLYPEGDDPAKPWHPRDGRR